MAYTSSPHAGCMQSIAASVALPKGHIARARWDRVRTAFKWLRIGSGGGLRANTGMNLRVPKEARNLSERLSASQRGLFVS